MAPVCQNTDVINWFFVHFIGTAPFVLLPCSKTGKNQAANDACALPKIYFDNCVFTDLYL